MSDENAAPEREDNTFSVERVLPLIDEFKGNISAIARHLGKSRSQTKDYIDRKPELLTALRDWRESIIDHAEENIFDEVLKGDSASSKMVVATLGKDRGWVPRNENTGKDGKDLIPPTITFAQYPDDDEEAPPAEEPANV